MLLLSRWTSPPCIAPARAGAGRRWIVGRSHGTLWLTTRVGATDSYYVLDRLERGIDEQRAIVIAPAAEGEHEIAVALHVIGNAETRLELSQERLTVVPVRDIVVWVDAGRLPARIGPDGGRDGCRRYEVIVYRIGFIVPAQARADLPMIVRPPIVLHERADFGVVRRDRLHRRGVDRRRIGRGLATPVKLLAS